MKFLCLLMILATAGFAQDSTGVTGPVAGFIFDPQARDLRPMLGVPGSSYLGAPLADDLDLAAVSPDGEAALAVTHGSLVLIYPLRGLSPAITVMEAAIAGVDHIAWSPDGAIAALYSSSSGQAQIVRGTASKPVLGAAIAVQGTLTALAVSAAGDLAIATEDSLTLLPGGGQPQLLASVTQPAAIAFRGSDMFVADTGANRVLQIESFASAPVLSTFAGPVEAPVGLQVSADGKRLYLAGSTSRTVTAFDIAGRNARGSVELDCAPSELRPAGGPDLWFLNSDRSAQDPLYVVTGNGDPVAWFVPAGREQ
jgi:sugar lactone lactonase YvrE